MELRVLLVYPAVMDCQVLLALTVRRERQDLKVRLVYQAAMDFRDQQVAWEHQVQSVPLGRKVQPASKALVEHQVLLEVMVLQDLTGFREVLDLRVRLEHRVRQGHQDCRGRLVLLVYLVRSVQRDYKVFQERQDKWVLQGKMETPDCQVLLDLRALKGQPEVLGCQDLMDCLEVTA